MLYNSCISEIYAKDFIEYIHEET